MAAEGHPRGEGIAGVEGGKIGVEEIRFVGNNAFGAWRLKRQMTTVESGYFGWLRTTDTYDIFNPDTGETSTWSIFRALLYTF